MNSVGPFTPGDAFRAHKALVPEEVYEAVNRLLAEKFDNCEIKIHQAEVVSLVLGLMNRDCKPISYIDVFEKGLLNKITDEYRRAGWDVEYYVDSKKDAYWIFKRLNRRVNTK